MERIPSNPTSNAVQGKNGTQTMTTSKHSPLRVCIDARIISGRAGGVEQFVIGLASGLSRLSDGDEEYAFLAYADSSDWIRPYVEGPCRMVYGPAATFQPGWVQSIRTLPGVRRVLNTLRPLGTWLKKLPHSDGLIEHAGISIMHFTTQSAFLTCVPSIYHPWDLQHIHFPQFFSPRARKTREIAYRAFCQQASMVSVAASWDKEDLIRHYDLADNKVHVVPCAPVLTSYPAPSKYDLMATIQKFSLPERFIFYPAQTWPHKNHVGLLEALSILRERHGLIVPLVSSGHANEFYPTIEHRVRELRLTEQVQFLGFVTPLDLRSLFTLCRGLVFPSKFEGFGMPIIEAFWAGVPTACSNVASLPEQAGDAALLFDPEHPEEIARAIALLWTDDTLCNSLIEKGRRRADLFSWDRSARLFRAHYRRIAGHPLTQEDQALLGSPNK